MCYKKENNSAKRAVSRLLIFDDSLWLIELSNIYQERSSPTANKATHAHILHMCNVESEACKQLCHKQYTANSIKVVFLKALTVNYERARDAGLLFIYAQILITFVASKFAVVSFLYDLEDVSPT